MTNENGEEELHSAKIASLTLKSIALIILLINAVLLSLPKKDLLLIGILLVAGTSMLILGFALSHLPPRKEEGKTNDARTHRIRIDSTRARSWFAE